MQTHFNEREHEKQKCGMIHDISILTSACRPFECHRYITWQHCALNTALKLVQPPHSFIPTYAMHTQHVTHYKGRRLTGDLISRYNVVLTTKCLQNLRNNGGGGSRQTIATLTYFVYPRLRSCKGHKVMPWLQAQRSDATSDAFRWKKP